MGSDATIAVNYAQGNLTVSGDIGQSGGSFGLNVSGGGILTLSGIDSYTGGTTVSGGTLVLANASALPSSGVVTVGGSGSVSLESIVVGPGVVVADAGSSPSATLPTQLPAVPAVSTLSVAEQPVVTAATATSVAPLSIGNAAVVSAASATTVSPLSVAEQPVVTAAATTTAGPLSSNDTAAAKTASPAGQDIRQMATAAIISSPSKVAAIAKPKIRVSANKVAAVLKPTVNKSGPYGCDESAVSQPASDQPASVSKVMPARACDLILQSGRVELWRASPRTYCNCPNLAADNVCRSNQPRPTRR